MIEIKVREQTFLLCQERAVFWVEQSLLAVADFHLGKAESFQQHGLILPSKANFDDLERLMKLSKRINARQILFVGDLVHTARGITAGLEEAFACWTKQTMCQVQVVIGNHDRYLAQRWPKSWQHIMLFPTFELDGIRFSHEVEEGDDNTFVWCGHIHPMISLKFGPDQLRLPCFVVSDAQGLMPAYSTLAGGMNIRPKSGERVYPISDKVFAL